MFFRPREDRCLAPCTASQSALGLRSFDPGLGSWVEALPWTAKTIIFIGSYCKALYRNHGYPTKMMALVVNDMWI